MNAFKTDFDPFESELRDAFQRIGGAIPVGEPAACELTPIEDERQSFGRRRFLIAVSGAAAAAAVGGLALIKNRRGEDRTASDAATAPVLDWQLVDDPAAVFSAPEIDSSPRSLNPPSVSIQDVLATPAGVIAVGQESVNDGSVAAVWRSAEGDLWERIGHADSLFGTRAAEVVNGVRVGTYMTRLAEVNGLIVALGHRFEADGEPGTSAGRSTPLAWTSADGLLWKRTNLDVTSAEAEVTAFAPGLGGFIAIGRQFTEGAADRETESTTWVSWRSLDGAAWSRGPIDIALGVDPTDIEVRDVIATAFGVVAVGEVGGRAAAWSSADGTIWTRLAMESGDAGSNERTMAGALANSNGRLVAIGTRQTEGAGWRSENGKVTMNGASSIMIWSSATGATWERIDHHALADEFTSGGPVAGGPKGFVIVSRVIRNGLDSSVTMASADGNVWQESPTGLPGGRAAIAALPAGWIAVGNAGDTPPTAPPDDPADPIYDSTVWLSK